MRDFGCVLYTLLVRFKGNMLMPDHRVTTYLST